MLLDKMYRISKFSRLHKFFLYNIISVLLFAFLYWFNDWFITNHPDFAVNYMKTNKGDGKVNTFIYYLWFSLITQTTVGYTGIINTSGVSEPFSKIPFWTFKLLNIIQLFSIFYIPILTV